MPTTNRPDGTIEITYGTRRTEHGGMPAITINGRERTSWARGYDRDVALAMARAMADDEASRYVGDWHVTVTAEGEA